MEVGGILPLCGGGLTFRGPSSVLTMCSAEVELLPGLEHRVRADDGIGVMTRCHFAKQKCRYQVGLIVR